MTSRTFSGFIHPGGRPKFLEPGLASIANVFVKRHGGIPSIMTDARESASDACQPCATPPVQLESLPMEDVVVRPAASADFDEILALWASIDRHVGLADRIEHLNTLHAHAPDLFLVAEHGGELVGTLIAGWDGWRAQMARLAVTPALRRSGIARRLVEEGERRLREKGAERIYALVDRRSDPAAPFWSAQGYAVNENIAQFSRNLPEAR